SAPHISTGESCPLLALKDPFMETRDHVVGPTAVRAALLPGRAVYLVADRSEEGLRRTVQEACTRPGRIGRPDAHDRLGSAQYQDTVHGAAGSSGRRMWTADLAGQLTSGACLLFASLRVYQRRFRPSLHWCTGTSAVQAADGPGGYGG